MTPWPCTTCGQPGIRNIGTQGHCATHLGDLYHTFTPATFALHGIGLPGRSNNPHHLECAACGATWDGLPGEECRWCAHSLARMHEWQAEAALTPPDVDPHDTQWATRMGAWIDRLKVAIDAELITKEQAARAVNRTQVAWERAHENERVA